MRFFITILTFLSLTGQYNLFAAPPANDDCSGAISLTSGTTCTTTNGTIASATGSTPATACFGTATDDVWYSFVATSSTQIITVTPSANFDAVVELLSGSCTSMTSITCEDNGLQGDDEVLTANGLTVSNTYYVRVYEYGSTVPSTKGFKICVTGLTCPGNLGTGVINIASLPYSVTGKTTCGQVNDLTSSNMPTCGSSSYFTGEDVVYTFTPTSTGTVTINLTSSGSYTGLMLYNGCPFNGNCIGNTQDASGSKSICTSVVSGITYYLIIDSYATPDCNPYGLSITAVNPAGVPNDDPCGATLLGVASSCSFTTYTNTCASASTSVADPGCGSYDGGDVWFKFVVPASGKFVIDTKDGGITDAGMAIYTGSCSALTLIECDDDNSTNGSMPMICRAGSNCNIPGDCDQNGALTPGDTVFIRFWEYGNDVSGTFGLCVYEPPVPAGTCSALIGTGVVNVSSVPYNSGAGTTQSMGNDITALNVVSGPDIDYLGGQDKVFIFTPTTSGVSTISVNSASGSYLGLMLFKGCPMNCATTTGTFINGSYSGTTNSTGMAACLTAGTTYYLVLDSYASIGPAYNAYTNVSISAPGSATTNNDYCFAPQQIAPSASNLNDSTMGNTVDEPDNLTTIFCGSIENNQWFSFTATAFSATFNFSNITGTACVDGIQAEVFAVTKSAAICSDCETFIQKSNCWDTMQKVSGSVTATNLVIGQSYVLMVDGFAGDLCKFRLSGWGPVSLPVEWLTINAEKKENGNLVSWSTGSEKNSDYFAIERSADAITFYPVGSTPAAGNSNIIRYYSFLDENPVKGLNYYRIKQYDKTGQFMYSKIVVVDNSIEGILISISPNPTNSSVELNIISSGNKTFGLTFYDVAGRLLFQKTIVTQQASSNIRLTETASLAKGVYILNLIDENTQKTVTTQKILKY